MQEVFSAFPKADFQLILEAWHGLGRGNQRQAQRPVSASQCCKNSVSTQLNANTLKTVATSRDSSDQPISTPLDTVKANSGPKRWVNWTAGLILPSVEAKTARQSIMGGGTGRCSVNKAANSQDKMPQLFVCYRPNVFFLCFFCNYDMLNLGYVDIICRQYKIVIISQIYI